VCGGSAALQQEKKLRSRHASSLQLSLYLKNKFFLGKKSSAAAPDTNERLQGRRYAPPLAFRASKQKHGAGVVRARPPHNYPLALAKFGAGKFCLTYYFRPKHRREKEHLKRLSKQAKGAKINNNNGIYKVVII